MVLIYTKKNQNRSRNGLSMTIFSLRNCVILLRTTRDKTGSFGADLYQKDPKSVKKCPSNGHFLPERLRDSIENHMGPRGILLCSFLPKGSKTSQEIAELWLFSHKEVAWYNWEPHGTKGDPWVFICAKKIQNQSRNGWVMAIFTLRGCVISLRTTLD